jgi:sugar lactone lactonase YvrE
MIFEPELILDAHADLGEGPAWESQTGVLYWVDIHAGRLHIFSPQDGSDRSIGLAGYLGCAAPRRLGGVVLGLQSGFATIDSVPLSGKAKVRIIANPEPHLPGNRFNDGKCDPAGRFLAGSMDDAEIEQSGSLYSLNPDGMVKTLLRGTRIANGLAWSPDYKTFYFIDTPTRTVMAYDYDLGTGALANARPAITVPTEMGWPDGMTSDAQGRLWVALWGGAKLTRWNPASGQLLEEIPLPALNVSSCVFGGPHLTDLYVTTARKGMDADQLAKYPFSGGLFRIRTNIQGLLTFMFGG